MVASWRRMLALSFGSGIPRRPLIVAVIVGRILNLINQVDRIIDGTSIDWQADTDLSSFCRETPILRARSAIFQQRCGLA
jgi:hypothetical protein